MMRWTGWVAIAAVLLALAGCGYGYGYRMTGGQGRYSASSRPDPSYFCYDCHGYRYFDPYYDYCAGSGFRYRWSDHPRAMIVYRDRYVRIKEAHPDYGSYRYRPGYRSAERYRDPRDYESWRTDVKQGSAPEARPGRERAARGKDRESGVRGKDREQDREKDGQEPGTKKQRKGEQRKGPRDNGSRLTLPGGVS